MNLIERIETYKQMAKEMKEITPEVSSVTFRLNEVSIEDMQMLSAHYGKPLEKGMTRRLLIHLLDYLAYSIFIYSVECEIKSTIEYIPVQQKEVA